jgi:hypothetical protein
MTINQTPKINLLMLIIMSLILVFLYPSVVHDLESIVSNNNVKDYSAHAQINSFNKNMSTTLGDVKIPSNSNDTMTTVINNASNHTIPTAINKTLVAQNVTSAVNFLKENTTTPISPTGISTQGLHQPPQHRLVNNNNTDSTSSISNTNNTNNTNQLVNYTNKATQQDTNNISSKITEGAKDLIGNIGKGLENLGK